MALDLISRLSRFAEANAIGRVDVYSQRTAETSAARIAVQRDLET